MLEMTLGSRVEALGPGAGVIVPPNVTHALTNRSGGVATIIEFHTVRRPDLVPPHPTLTFPAAPSAVAVPEGRTLVVPPDEHGRNSSTSSQTIDGQTCTLSLRRLSTGVPSMNIPSERAEVFVYLVRGTAELVVSETQRAHAGSLIVVPAGEHHAKLRAIGPDVLELVVFSVPRR